MTKRTIKKFLTSAFLILLSVAMLTCFLGCNKVDVDTNADANTKTDAEIDSNADVDTNTNADIENNTDPDNTDDSVQAGVTGDAENSEAPDEEQGKKRVAITFDDGPHNVRTQAIVDELDKYGFHATFFVVGNRVDGKAYGGGKTIPYILEHGNEIGIHGYTHEVYYNKCDDATYEYELSETLNAIHKYAQDYAVTLMRPIGGHITDERVAACNYSVIMWNVDSEDWRYKYTSADTDEEAAAKVNTIVENVMSQVNDGSIILLHDIYQSTVDAVVKILERLNAEGYEVVTVSELLGETKAGVKYSRK
jgi:peptidoglycan/xylan/chitin deacetylase (PgdA/CDA1 family)